MIDLATLSQLESQAGSPESLVQKALTSTTASVAAQTLNGDQMREFIRLVVSEQVGLSDSTKIQVNGPSLDISNVNIPDGQYAMGLGGTTQIAVADEVTPVFDRRVLTPQPIDVRMPIETTILMQVNIEGEGIRQTMDEILADYVGNQIENEAWNAQIGGTAWDGYGTGAMTTIDGWLATARTAGHAIDFDGARMSTEILREMLQALPTKWRGKGEVFYMSSDNVIEWAHHLEATRQTNLGDRVILEDGAPTFMGRRIIGVPRIRDDYAGLNNQSGSTSGFTAVLLTVPGNKVIGFNPAMRVFVHPRDDGKVDYINYWGQFDVDFFNVDRVVIGYNITPLARCDVACD